MLKRMLMVAFVVGGFSVVSPTEANAWIVRRVVPVRRMVARTVFPPYPVARQIVARPMLRRRVVYGRPVIYAAPVYVSPVVVGPRVSVGGGYYGW